MKTRSCVENVKINISYVDPDVSEPPVLVPEVFLELVEVLPARGHAQTVAVKLEHGPMERNEFILRLL